MNNSSAKSLPAMKSDLSPISPLRFLGICTLFLVLANWLPDSVFSPLNRATASLSGECLALFGKKAVVAGDMVSLNGFRVLIVTECTALYSVMLFSALLLAAPATLKARLAGLAAGAALLGSVNILRIAAVVAVGSVNPALFEIVHVYLGQVVMMLTVVAAALVWLRLSAPAADPFPFVLRAGVLASVLFLPWLAVNRFYVALLDKLVVFIFAIFHPGYLLTIPRPFFIYNHTFEAPLYLSLIFASRTVGMRRKVVGAVAGLLIIAGWHTLNRVTHVIWTAYDVEGILPFHMLFYLLGQYLLPFFLWLLVTSPPLGLMKGLGGKASRLIPLLLVALFFAAWPAGARGEAEVVIQPDANNGFTMRAEGLKDISGGEIRLDYMTYGQTAPNVTVIGLGAQAGLLATTDSPGTIVFTFTSRKPLNGGGMLARLMLTGQDGDSGQILSLSALLRNDKGVEESARTSFTNPPDNQQKSPPPAATPKTWPRDRSSIGQGVPGAVNPVQEIISTAPLTPQQRPPAGPVPFRRLESVLDRFHGYAGKMTQETIDRLFAPIGAGEFLQEPAVLIADGLEEARLTFRPTGDGEEITCFIITGGHCTALRKGETAGEWILHLVPERGALSTSVAVQTAQGTAEYPLTVAPPMSLYRPATDREDLPYLREFVRIANERAHPSHLGETVTEGNCNR
jgi:exosortase H (IPTLxxWG-CTERM-specific)